MTDLFEFKWQQRFKETETFLKEQYPELAEMIDQHFWYGDLVSGAQISGLEDMPLTVDPRFWNPGDQAQGLFLANVNGHLNDSEADPKNTPLRLRTKKIGENYAPLSEVPTCYGDRFESFMNDRTIRLERFGATGIQIRQACYLDQLGSNILCDKNYSGKTARELDKSSNGGLRPLEESALANTVGVACMFVGSDNIPVMRWREQSAKGEQMAIMQKGWHCTSSGVLKFDDVIDLNKPDEGYTLRDFRKGLFREANYETGIWQHEELYNCELVGFARELKRAGKPQFFYRLQFKTMTAKEITDLIRERPKREGDEYSDRLDHLGLVGKLLKKIKTPQPGEMGDMFVDPRFNLDQLTRAELFQMAETLNNRMTYECFANLWFMAKR